MLKCWHGENRDGFTFGNRSSDLPHYIAFRKTSDEFNKVCCWTQDNQTAIVRKEVADWLKETLDPSEVFYGETSYAVFFLFAQESYVALFKMRWM
jgi:hypothetical protein